MSNETLLYICGIILAVSAVGVSFLGLKVKGFPGKAMPLVVVWFAIFVVGSATFAVLYSKEEAAHKEREAKLEEANERAEADKAEAENAEGAEGSEGEAEEGAEEAAPEEGEAGAEEGEAGVEEGAEEGATGGGAGGEGASGGDPEAGAEVFAANCSVCHGETGRGGGGGPDLTTTPKAQNEPETIEQVTDGGSVMPAFGGDLSEEEIENVAAFVVQKVVGNG